jgi:hypothetical protein
MHLFQTENLKELEKYELYLSTPIGELKFYVKIGNQLVNQHLPEHVYSFLDNGRIAIWSTANDLLEFLQLTVLPNLPSNMYVEKCVIAMWRVKKISDFNQHSMNFECRWKSIPYAQNYPDTGQGLEAQCWKTSEHTLMIGTEDIELLKGRAYRNENFPKRFEELLDKSNSYGISYLTDGLSMTLPSLLRDEVAQVHFVVAWTKTKDQDTSTWFAVDIPSQEILRLAHCH